MASEAGPHRSTSTNSLSNKNDGDTTDLPPDVARKRLERINSDLIDMMRKPYHPTASMSPLRGNGTYTHAGVNVVHRGNNTMTVETRFVPLGGGKASGTAVKVALDEEVQTAYNKLKDALKEEAMFNAMHKDYDYKTRVGALPVPEIPQPAPVRNYDLTIEEPRLHAEKGIAEVGDLQEEEDMPMDISPSSEPERRTSTVGSNREKWHTPSLTAPENISTASGNMAFSVGGRSGAAATVGTTYDASRDPRRRRH